MSASVETPPIAQLSEVAQRAPDNAVEAAARVLRVTTEHTRRGGAVARLLNAVAHLAEVSDDRSLIDASGARSDYEVLIQVLDRPEVLAELRQYDPLLPARLRGLRVRERLLAAEGGTYTAQEAATAMGISRQAVDNRRRRGRLIGLQLGRRGYAYPVWQFTAGGVLPGLDAVARRAERADALDTDRLPAQREWLARRRTAARCAPARRGGKRARRSKDARRGGVRLMELRDGGVAGGGE